MHISSLWKSVEFLKVNSSYCPETKIWMNSVKNWRNLPISNPKADLYYNINAQTEFGENPMIFKMIMTCGTGLDLLQSSGEFPCAICHTGVGNNSIFCNSALGAQEMQDTGQLGPLQTRPLTNLAPIYLLMIITDVLTWTHYESAYFKYFVCVEVLQPSHGVMSSVVSLPNHTFTGQA